MKTILIAILLAATLFAGCAKPIEPMAVEQLRLDCVDAAQLQGKEFVIASETEYIKLFNYRVKTKECTETTLPPIDFAEKTLIGKYVDATGCSVNLDRSIFRDDIKKQVIYTVTVQQQGSCEKLAFDMNWILIPKLPEDYNVVFDVKRENVQ